MRPPELHWIAKGDVFVFLIYKPREVLAPSRVCCFLVPCTVYINFLLLTLARDRIAAAESNRITDCLNKNLKASRPSEHPSIRGGNAKRSGKTSPMILIVTLIG